MTKLWTIQDASAWKVAQKRGVLRADGRRVYAFHRPSYHWMMDRMCERIPHYQGGFPIWAWEHKIDLRHTCLLPRGTLGVRVVCEIEESKLLRSDFEHWHAILNNTLLPLSQDEWANWVKEGASQEVARRSWDQVFDLRTLAQAHAADPAWMGRLGRTQVVLEQIPLESVSKVDFFTAR